MAVDRSGFVGFGGVSPQGGARIPKRCENTDFPWLVGNFEKFSSVQQREFYALADTFFSSESQFIDRVFQQISARKRELGKPLSRSEARELYLHTMVGIFSHSHASFIDALDRALDRAETAGNLRASEPAFLSRAWKRVRDSVIGSHPKSPNVALDLLPPPTKKEARPNENGPKTIVILMPPIFKSEASSSRYIREMRALDPHIHIIGDGISNLHQDSLLSMQNAHPEAAVHIHVHGALDSGTYNLQPATGYSLSPKDLFSTLSEILGKDFVGTVHLYACRSKFAQADAGYLPKGAVLVTYTDEKPSLTALDMARGKKSVAAAATSLRFSAFQYPDTVIFTDNSRKLTCSVPRLLSPPRTIAQLQAHVQHALQNCKHPEIVAAANRMKVSLVQLKRYHQEAFIVHAAKGDVDSMRAYWQAGLIDINGALEDGTTALAVGTHLDRRNVVEWLLSFPNIEVSKAEFYDQIPLVVAAKDGNAAMVGLLLKDPRVDPILEFGDEGSTPLMLAAARGHDAVVREFLKDKRVNPGQGRKGDNVTAVALAVDRGHKSTVELLLADSRTDPNALEGTDQITLLCRAISKHDLAMMRTVLRCERTDPNQRLGDGSLALFRAIQFDQPQQTEGAVALLLSDQRVDLSLEFSDVSALTYAAQLGRAEVVRQLLARSDNPNQKRSSDGITPLHMAVYLGRSDVVKVLVADPRVNLEQKMTKPPYATPLDLAREKGNRKITALLDRAIAERKSQGAERGK